MTEATKRKELSPRDVVTPPVRLAFPALFKPRPKMKVPGGTDEKQRLTYQAVLLMPPEIALEPFHAAMKAAMLDKFGKIEKLPADRNPIRSCDEKAGSVDGYEPGWRYINTHSGYAPAVVDQRRQPILDQDAIFAGCWCRFHINAYAWIFGAKKGVSFSLNAVQLVRTDERLDGRSNVDDVFEALEDAGANTASADDMFAS